MSFSPSPRRRLIFPSLAALAICGGALAPVASATAAPYRSPFPKSDTLVQGRGAAQRGTRIPKPAALESFKLDYARTWDTAIRDIGLEIIEGRRVRAWLSDDSAKASLTLRATWRSVAKSRSVEYRRLSAVCGEGRCRIGGAIEQGSNKVPLLTGFVFHGVTGAQNIERLAVFPEKREGPNRQYTYIANLESSGDARYTIDVNVVLVDPEIIAGEYNAGARSEGNTGYTDVPLRWENGILALQGFDVRFRNGAHQLQEFAIENVTGNNSIKRVRFNDTNDDDPVEAKLWWADLKTPGIRVIPMDRPLPRNPPKKRVGPTPQLNPATGGTNGGSGSTRPTPKNPPRGPVKRFPGGKIPRPNF